MRGPVFGLQHFTPTAGTKGPLALARALTLRSPASPRLIVLHGPTGAGKTHLMHAVLRQARKRRSAVRVVRATAVEVVERLIEATQQQQRAISRLGWQGADFIAVDDLQVLAGRERTQIEVARLLRAAVEAGSRVLGAAGGPLSALEPLLTELRKTPAFTLANLGPATDRDLRRILAGRLGRADARPSPRALTDILASAEGDVRRAIGGLNRHCFVQLLRSAGPPLG